MPKKNSFLYHIPSDAKEDDYYHNENIVDAAAGILKKLVKYDEIVCCAQMQSGKTDVMKRLIFLINKYNDKVKEMGVEIDKFNIYLVICASSLGLKEQLKSKLPEIKHKIFHLNDICNFIKNKYENESRLTEMADSGLIIFDECHCDAEQQKLIDKFRILLDHTAKINKTSFHRVGFSATPYEQIISNFPKVIMEPSTNYYGMKQMFESSNQVIFQAKNLENEKECKDLMDEIEIIDMYYIIRLPGRKVSEDAVMHNMQKLLKKHGHNVDSYVYDMEYKQNINELLKEKPIKPTIIYLKDKMRMGEYLNTKHVYMVHDDPKNLYTHTTAQSLIGRCCGYNKKSHGTVIYCDYEKAYQHYQWIISGYHIEQIPYNAKYIKKSTGETKDICIY